MRLYQKKSVTLSVVESGVSIFNSVILTTLPRRLIAERSLIV